MKGRMKIESPDEVEVTLTITMTAKQWCEIRDQLADKWPSWQLSSMITKTLAQVRRIIWEDGDVSP